MARTNARLTAAIGTIQDALVSVLDEHDFKRRGTQYERDALAKLKARLDELMPWDATPKTGGENSCANCARVHATLPDVCIPAALMRVLVSDREEMTHKQALDALAALDPDALWDDVGPIIDRLGEGYYSMKETSDAENNT